MRNRPKEAICQDCGAVYIKYFGVQVRCASCQKAYTRKKHREQQAKFRSRWYSSEAKDAKKKKQARRSDAKEAAERLGISPEILRAKLYRARKYIRRKFKDKYDLL